MPRIPALNPDIAPSLDDLLPLYDVQTETTKRVTLLNALNAKSATTFTVNADGTGDYPTIQAALDAVPDGGARILISSGAYSLGTGLVVKKSGTVLEGEGTNTQLTFSGGTITTAIVMTTTALEGIEIRNLYLIRDNTPGTGVGIDLSDSPFAIVENVRADFFDIGLKIDDVTNNSLYCAYRNLILNCNTGIQLSGSLVRNNTFDTIRIRPTAGANGTGLDLQTSKDCTFINMNTIPLTGTGITGVALGAGADNNIFIGLHSESNATGVSLASGATSNYFIGGEIIDNTADLSDSGTNTAYLGVSLTASTRNQIGTTDIAGTNGTLTLSANTDGGEYNLGASSTGTLALFGAGGSTLNLNLLDGRLIVSTSQTPASASATGTTGTIVWDSSYIYICTATNTWKRVAISSW